MSPNPDPGPAAEPAQQLAALLETAPAAVRQEIVSWLLAARPAPAPLPAAVGVPWLPSQLAAPCPPETAVEAGEQVRRLAGSLPAGADSQVVTLRLPAQRHAALRDWCAEHGFSMAAVVRGLVERFLEEQSRSAP